MDGDQDFIESRGVGFLAHLLKRLHDEFVRGFQAWNEEVGLLAPPRTHSTLLALHEFGELSVTELASVLRQSHPLVITWIRQLKQLGLVRSAADRKDARRAVLSLTETGEKEIQRMQAVERVVEDTYRQLMAEADADVLDALWRMERACRAKSFHERLRAETDKDQLEGKP